MDGRATACGPARDRCYWSTATAAVAASGGCCGASSKRPAIRSRRVSLAPPYTSIGKLVPQLAQRIEEVCKATGADRVALIAHSMGGLVCRPIWHATAATGSSA